MPYTVFALKWRPKNFDEIIGQPHIVSTLKSAIQKERLANAYLFAGPRGVGKTSTARILAKALNCKDGPKVNPCQECSSCREISSGRSLDVIEIDGASNTGVDNIRDLRESVKFSPVSGKFKIYIIDEVHMLSDAAFNALLKTLEEPPPYIKFIFATTHPQDIIPTILSRCQRFDFRRISTMEIIAQLENICSSEKIGIDKEVLFAISKASDGSLRDAESILDQLFSFSKQKISLKEIVTVLGMVEQEALFEITAKIIKKDARGALELLNLLIEEGKDAGVFLANLIEHYRNLMVAKITKGDMKLIDLPQDICERLLTQSEALSLEEIFAAFNILVKAKEISKRLDSLRIPLEITLVRLAHDKKGQASFVPASKGPEKSGSFPVNPPLVKAEKNQAVLPEKEEDTPSSESLQQLTMDSIKGIWQNLIDSLGRIKMSVATYLSEGEPLKLSGGLLTVSFPKSYSLHKESLEKKDNKALIEKMLSECLKENLRINFVLSNEPKPKVDGESSGFLKSALDMFGGRVIRED